MIPFHSDHELLHVPGGDRDPTGRLTPQARMGASGWVVVRQPG